jgi:ATP-dependent DNA helicase RecG
MIKISDGDSFEGRRSILQKLTFDELRKEFKNRGITLDTLKEKTLGIVDHNGLYTNLGLLLSDECPYTIKCAVFGGTDKVKFIDRKEFGGSIFRQMADCYEYLDLNNPTSASFEGLYRNDHRDFPENAVREALLNSLVHRDYSYSASTLISIYSDRMEFVSVGGLLPGIQIQDVLLGLSICRNKRLADIFYRMKLIEAYGTGIQKIFSAYAGQARQPDIETGPNSFKLVLPRCGEEINENEPLLPAEQQIMELFANKNFIMRSEVNEALGVSQSTASRLLKQMIAKGRIEKYGGGKNTKYGKKKSENES